MAGFFKRATSTIQRPMRWCCKCTNAQSADFHNFMNLLGPKEVVPASKSAHAVGCNLGTMMRIARMQSCVSGGKPRA